MKKQTLNQVTNNQTFDQELLKGFTGAFTWENIGTQVANGIISGGASFAIGMLLKTLTEQNTNMSQMFQKFADQIVDRLSIKMKEIIAEAFYQQNFGELRTDSSAMESEYRAYLTVHSFNLLDHLEEISFGIDEKAKAMEIPAIGIYCVQKTIQISIFKEKAKFNIHYKVLVKEKIKESKKYLDDLRKKAVDKILTSFSYKEVTLYDDRGEISSSEIHIYYEGRVIDSVITFINGKDEMGFDETYEFHKQQKIAEFDKQVFLPAKAIIDKL